jgi:uncharacterized protein YkwD
MQELFCSMSQVRWRSPLLACTIVFAACSSVRTDQPAIMVAKNPALAARLAVAIAKPSRNPSPVPLAENPTAVMRPAFADTTDLPIVAQEPVAAASAPPIAAEATPAPIKTQPVESAAKNIPAVSPPVVAEAVDAPSASNPPAAETKRPAPTFDGRILAAHNRERQTLGLEPLNWNPALAQSAQRWAEHLAQTGRFEHAPENHAAPEGENLWAGTKGYYTPEAMVDAWIREKRFFRPGTFPDNSTTGRVEDIGHYTQVVWRATREVGCAEAASPSEDILVCRYAEAGNYRGEQPF